MGSVVDTITCFKDSLTGSAFEALTVASGDSLSLRFLDANAEIKLLEAWGANNTTKCDFSIRSPLLHDNTRGIRFAHMYNPTQSGADGNPQLYMGDYEVQKYRPSDTLIVEALGAASDDVTLAPLGTHFAEVYYGLLLAAMRQRRQHGDDALPYRRRKFGRQKLVLAWHYLRLYNWVLNRVRRPARKGRE